LLAYLFISFNSLYYSGIVANGRHFSFYQDSIKKSFVLIVFTHLAMCTWIIIFLIFLPLKIQIVENLKITIFYRTKVPFNLSTTFYNLQSFFI
ncbi:hypothetical protein, partial [Priestia megaterium]|uniref:hypothetical protein n=4 Tax=Priestia megaterium TaxID=1404 RepID=UPI002FFDA442